MKKTIKSIKNNIVGFIIGTIIFGSIGVVVAGTVASSEITYSNNGQSNVQGALNDLYGKTVKYNGVDIKYKYEYPNNSSSYTSLSTITGAPFFNKIAVFFRTMYYNGNPKDNGLCAYIIATGKMACIDHMYWASTVGTTTASAANANAVMSALKDEFEGALDITLSCSSDSTSSAVYCNSGSGEGTIYVRAKSNGEVALIGNSAYTYNYNGINDGILHDANCWINPDNSYQCDSM